MEQDYIRQLGYKALDNRLKRISDKMAHDTRKFFKEIDVDIEPSWHLVFKLLQDKKELTMVAIAEQLGYSHPSTVVMLKKMAAKGYLVSETDKSDRRKQNIRLSAKAVQTLPELELIWDSCENAIFKLLDEDLSILSYLDLIEDALCAEPFNQRFYNEYQQQLIAQSQSNAS